MGLRKNFLFNLLQENLQMFNSYTNRSAKKITFVIALFTELQNNERAHIFPRINPFEQSSMAGKLFNSAYCPSVAKLIKETPIESTDSYFDGVAWSKTMNNLIKPYYAISSTKPSDNVSLSNLFIFIFFGLRMFSIKKIIKSNKNTGYWAQENLTDQILDKIKSSLEFPYKLTTYQKQKLVQLFAEFLYKIPLILQPNDMSEDIKIVNDGYYTLNHKQLKPFNQLIKAQALSKFIELLQFDISSYLKNPSTNLVGPYVSFGSMPYCASLLILGTSKNRTFDFEVINTVGTSLAMANREYQNKIVPNVQSLDDLLNPFSETTDIFLDQDDFINCLPNLFGDKTNKKRLVTDLYNYHNDPQSFIDQSLNNKSDFIFPEIMYLPAFIH